jgi:DNA polymerase III epsilon subunit family exonuclease
MSEIDWRYVKDEFVIIDFETTGLKPEQDRIIEVGALRFNKEKYRNSKQVDIYNTLIKIDEKLPEKIVDITSITDEMLQEGGDIKSAIKGLLEFIGDRNVLAYNAPFDFSFLVGECKRAGIILPNELKFHCVYELAREALPGMPNYKLDTLAKKIGLSGTKHRAIDDCSVTLQVFIACFQGRGARARYVDRFGFIQVFEDERKTSLFQKIVKKITG